MKKISSEYRFWEVETTSYSGGSSWFPYKKNSYDTFRFESEDLAKEFAMGKKLEYVKDIGDDPIEIFWRVVCVDVSNYYGGNSVIREWKLV